MKSDSDKLVEKHDVLIHSDELKVGSHIQREDGDWIQHTLMIDGYDVPFKFRRKNKYKSLNGSKVNLTYYSELITVAGFEVETMKVVRIKRY
jgi:hypothetical protein